MQILKYIFPYRYHLEAEVSYLQNQLSQERRRSDELQGAFRELLTKIGAKALQAPAERKPVPPPVEAKPRGWDQYRANRRGLDDETTEETAAVPV
jgi:hypothetical protein